MLLRQTLLYLPAQVVGPIVQFVSIILWTHFIDPQEMGTLALITAAQEFAYIGTISWFSLYTVRFFDRNAMLRGGDGAFLDTEAGVLLAGSLATILGLLSLIAFLDVDRSATLIGSSLAYCVSRTVATHLTDRARTAQDTRTYSALQIIWPVLSLVLGVVFVTLSGPTAANVLWGYALAQVLTLAAVFGRLGLGSHPFSMSRETTVTALKYGLPLVAGGAFVWLANNGLRFVIEHREGATAVGLVTVGWGLGLRAAAFAAMLVSAAAFPLAVTRAREHGFAEGHAQLVRNGILLLAILAPAAAGLWAISTPLVERIVAGPFRDMTAAVMPWAILAGTVRNMRCHFAQQIFLLKAETRVPLVNDMIDGVATLLGGTIGLAFGGLVGSVQGAAAGAALSLAVTLLWAGAWHQYTFPISHFLRILTATGIMVAALHFVPVSPDYVSLAFAVALGAAIYVLALGLVYPHGAGELIARVKKLRQA